MLSDTSQIRWTRDKVNTNAMTTNETVAEV